MRPAAVLVPRRLGVGSGLVALALAGGCSPPGAGDAHLRPDSVLRAELGLGDADRVHRITLVGGEREEVAPREVQISPGHWVEFVTADWRVHEIRFEVDSLGPEALAFMEGMDQMESPPMVERGARFVVSFRDAPEGRYPFRAEGNGDPGGGVVVVLPRR